jgi:hypothetical protein
MAHVSSRRHRAERFLAPCQQSGFQALFINFVGTKSQGTIAPRGEFTLGFVEARSKPLWSEQHLLYAPSRVFCTVSPVLADDVGVGVGLAAWMFMLIEIEAPIAIRRSLSTEIVIAMPTGTRQSSSTGIATEIIGLASWLIATD